MNSFEEFSNMFDDTPDYTSRGITLKCGCSACPEQYEAYTENGQCIGYLRLRHGRFTVECPDVGGMRVLEGYPEGDGRFMLSERTYWLDRAIDSILDWSKSQ